MPSTTEFGLRYPANTDTPDVPRDLQNLADDVEAALVEARTIQELLGTTLTWGNGSGSGVAMGTVAAPTIIDTCGKSIVIPTGYKATILHSVSAVIRASNSVYDFYVWNQARLNGGTWAAIQGSAAWGVAARHEGWATTGQDQGAAAVTPQLGDGTSIFHAAGTYEFRTVGGGDIAGARAYLIRGTAWVSRLIRA